MKTKKTLVVLILSIIFGMKIYAQAPVYSTAENPVWQYIQVIGTTDRMDRVFTAEEGRVYGRPMYTGLDRTSIDKQLWRLEKVTSTSIMIVNKATGKKLDVEYDSSLRLRVAILNDSPSTNWRFQRNGNNYNMRMLTEPAEGTAGNILAYQGISTSRRNYIIMFDAASKNSDLNAQFQFITFNNSLPVESNDKEVWYFIKSAKPGMENQCVTAIANPTDPYIKFNLAAKEASNPNQYWKFVKVTEDEENLHYYIQNKATREIISTEIILDKYFYVQNTTDMQEGYGWQFISINKEQFELRGKDGTAVRYLNAASSDTKSETYLAGRSENTGFAWTFEWAEGEVGITNPVINEEIRVTSEEKRIIVFGTDDYTVWNIYGSQVGKNVALPTGIYLVVINGEARKVIVK
ncbi:MAG: RICIN domain-containing protein [Bacteroidales bacterium]|nr:RICIN domain-containing protein [Bacteroidales bacterium]